MIGTIGVALAGLAGKVIGQDSLAAKVLGWLAVAAAAAALFFTAKAIYDASVIDEHERDVRAELNEGVIEGEQKASAAQRSRDIEFAEDQARIQEGMNDAAESDPDGAARPVGPVQQSYFDQLREKNNGRRD